MQLRSATVGWLYDFGKIWSALYFGIRPAGDPGLFRVVCKTQGNTSGFASNSTRLWIYNDTNPPAASQPTVPISGPMYLYPQKSDGTFPTSGVSYPSSPVSNLVLGMRDGDSCGELLSDETYWLVFENTAAQSNTVRVGVVSELNGTVGHSYSLNGTLYVVAGNGLPFRLWNVPVKDQGVPENNLDWIVMANDRNGETSLAKSSARLHQYLIILTAYRQSKNIFILGFTLHLNQDFPLIIHRYQCLTKYQKPAMSCVITIAL